MEYIIKGDYFWKFEDLKEGVKYNHHQNLMVEDKEVNRHVIRGKEYYGNGSIQDAIKLQEKINSLPSCKNPQSLMLDFAIANDITILELKWLQFHNNGNMIASTAISIDEFILNTRKYLSKLSKLSDMISDNMLKLWYCNGFADKMIRGVEDLNFVGMHVGDTQVTYMLNNFNIE